MARLVPKNHCRMGNNGKGGRIASGQGVCSV